MTHTPTPDERNTPNTLDDSSDPHTAPGVAAEAEAWARRERHRRQQWAQGPTPEQAALWATLERERRLAEHAGARGPSPRMGRSLRLCAVGMLRLLLTTSVRDALELLVREGLDWEERYSPGDGRRRPH